VAAICVFCASGDDIDDAYLDLAASLGTGIAAAGHSLVSGGGAVSMMGAVARAARDGGAHTLGVIPTLLVEREVGDTASNELVVVETMRERKRIMDENADAFVVLPGGIGTLEELFEVWTSHSLLMHDKPVIVLDPGGFYQPLFDWLAALVPAGFVRRAALDALHRVTTVGEALAVVDIAVNRGADRSRPAGSA
jgi:uncharacterized protein (TIGR00730 family)